ncbi:hypothetical protein [Tolypothrix sp. NIES-4075]|uniref:hypothetical protein n=1 Tax=Tolypothrix sp. NIES-4075 TaxID=2005459 RepID=UPI00117F057E|nr:hypothetical protein [Tolypothrix sp. NIES-4075]
MAIPVASVGGYLGKAVTSFDKVRRRKAVKQRGLLPLAQRRLSATRTCVRQGEAVRWAASLRQRKGRTPTVTHLPWFPP